MYRVEDIQKPQNFYVNSGSNAAFKGGKSRITIPLTFPPNTVKWYITFSSYRDEDKIKQVTAGFDLAAQLSKLIDKSGGLGFAINMLNQPPGGDVCDIYLLDYSNIRPYLDKEYFSYYLDASRENIRSGIIEATCCTDQMMYLGLKNPDRWHGIHVALEVAVIIEEEGYVMHHKD